MANIGDKFASAGSFIVDRAKDVSGYARLSIDLKTKEGYVESKYKELGKAYYEDHKDDEEPAYDIMLMIAEANEQIAEIKEELTAMKGMVVCKSCGHEVRDDDIYCSKCGAKIERPEPEPDFFDNDIEDEDNV